LTSWHVILVSFGLVIVGLLRQVVKLHDKRRTLRLTKEFLSKFTEWRKGEGEDQSLYNWMLGKAETVQAVLGTIGLMSVRRPFENTYQHDCPVILNAIPEIERAWHDRSCDNDTVDFHVQSVDVSLRRFIGSMEEEVRRDTTRLFNPLLLLCSGVGWVLELPLLVLNESNVITGRQRAIIAAGKLFSLLQAVGTVLMLVVALMTIVIKWDEFVGIVTGWVD